MLSFLKPKRPENKLQNTAPPVSVAPDSSQQQGSLHRELIRVVLKDTLRLQGIPLSWLACEVIVIARAPGQEYLHIQIIIMKWNEQLLRYAPALQQQLLLGLDRFDPSVDHSKYIVSWRFAPNCASPFTQMPHPGVWIQSTAIPAAEEPFSVLDRRHARRENAETKNQLSYLAPTELMPL